MGNKPSSPQSKTNPSPPRNKHSYPLSFKLISEQTQKLWSEGRITLIQKKISMQPSESPEIESMSLISVHSACQGSFLAEFKSSNNPRVSQIVHYTSQGQKIKNLQLGQNVLTIIQMASKNLAIICIMHFALEERHTLKIILWDLEKDQKRLINYERKTRYSEHSILVFSQSDTFCIQQAESERRRHGFACSQFYFTYYMMTTSPEPIFVASITIPQQKISLQFKVVKVDQRSKLALVGQKPQQGYADIFIHKVCQNGAGKWESHKFYPQIKDKCFLKVQDLWQIEIGKMYINLLGSDNNQNEININFIYDLKNETSRPAKFNIEEYHQLYIPGMYRSPRAYSGYSTQQYLSVYYVDIKRQKILATRKQDSANNYGKIIPSSNFDLNKLMFWKLQSGVLAITEIETVMMQYEMPEIVTFWLTNMVEDCEEDLLMMVANLVTEEDEM